MTQKELLPPRSVDWATAVTVVGIYAACALAYFSVGGDQRSYILAVTVLATVAFAAIKVYEKRAERHLSGVVSSFIRGRVFPWSVMVLVWLLLGGNGLHNSFLVHSAQPELQAAVEAAGQAEMKAYESLPKTDVSALGEHFVPDSVPYAKIARIVENHALRGWTLTNFGNPHRRRVLKFRGFRPLDLGGNEFEVLTTEEWKLPWYDPKTRTYPVIYHEINDQTYEMVKEDGKWLVKDDSYGKPASPIQIPPLAPQKSDQP